MIWTKTFPVVRFRNSMTFLIEKIKKYEYLEPKGEINLVKDPHADIMATICLDAWNIENVRDFCWKILIQAIVLGLILQKLLVEVYTGKVLRKKRLYKKSFSFVSLFLTNLQAIWKFQNYSKASVWRHCSWIF